ncbi:beta-lactamase [Gordonia neofelifaecis NRRL B-59395]|uniref:Beta-lactamase n=2 Tax=Gordonia TaxID=2053 RepID=F1YFN6_9ACTN|nr:beta-lactamase [Gordonia neofelifaecis NRRL B-59395]
MVRGAAALTAAAAFASLTVGPAAAVPAPSPLPVLPNVIFYPTSTMAPSAHPVALPRIPGRVSATYPYQGRLRSFDDYLRRTSARGLVVLSGGEIVDERYFGGYTAASHFNSWSVGKSITSTAVGIALGEGRIRSIDDPITRYLPELKRSGYNGVAIKDLLRMTSGQRYDESNVANVTAGSTGTTIRMVLGEPLKAQAEQSVREREPGSTFNYASMNTIVLGWLVAKVTGRSLADYVQDKIWRPAGMASPTPVGQDYSGTALAFASYHATTRDLARFGLLFARGGMANGRRVVPASWVRDATTPSAAVVMPGRARPGSVYGYGYQWWLGDGDRGDFLAVGVLGQYIYVSPRDHVVIAQNSEDLEADTNVEEAIVAFRAVAEKVRGRV